MIADGHCDVLWKMWEAEGALSFQSPKLQANEDRLCSGNIQVQTFAIFVPPNVPVGQRLKAALQMIDLFFQNISERTHAKWHLICDRNDLHETVSNQRRGALLSLEGASPLEGEIRYLRTLFRLGVRSVGLTWNGRNEAADGVEVPNPGGLTRFGKKLVQEMNRLGMAVDVSHLSERGFWDVMAISKAPVTASHSNCKRICPHPRNLTDRQIREMIRQDGLIGITFVPAFTANKTKVTIDDVLRHVEHVCSLGGSGHHCVWFRF